MVENEEKVMVYALVGECAVVVPAFLGCGVRKRKPIEQNRQRERGEAAAIIPVTLLTGPDRRVLIWIIGQPPRHGVLPLSIE